MQICHHNVFPKCPIATVMAAAELLMQLEEDFTGTYGGLCTLYRVQFADQTVYCTL